MFTGTGNATAFITNTVATAVQIDADAAAVAAPHITVGDAVVDESGGHATIAVTLDAPSLTDVTVTYTTQDASAVAGTDYVAKTDTLTILAGQASLVGVALEASDSPLVQ